MCDITVNDLYAVYDRLKDRYPLTLTNTYALDAGFTVDCPIIVGRAHGQIIMLYECDGLFVLDYTNEEMTRGTHTHPLDISEAASDITAFMEDQAEELLMPFPFENPLDIILDTDAGGDCDDMLAMAYLVWARRHLNVNLRAVTQCNGCHGGPDLIRTFFESLNEPVPPIGGPVGNARDCDSYCTRVLDCFGDGEIRPYPDAVTVLRRALSESENAVLCAIGPLNNIAALLESGPDEISPLDGVSLVRERCSKMVLMAGGFVNGPDGQPVPEWNALVDIPATRKTVKLCPVPIVFLPFETGLDMLTGGPLMDQYEDRTPLTLAFCLTGDTRERGGRHSWDPAALLYAIEGCGEYFEESPRGTVEIDDEGRTLMTSCKSGLHSYLIIRPQGNLTVQQCKDRIAGQLDRYALWVHKH